MSLLAELKKKLNAVYDRIDSLKAESDALDDEAYDLDVACRALEEDELYATKDLDEPLEPAEALLDPQPEAASPEFASEQGEAIEHMIATSDAVCEELSEAYTAPQIPEGFTPWSGGECPVSKDQVVELLFRESWAGDGNGRAIYISDPADYADLTQWKHHGQGGDIIAYRVIEAPAEAERTEVDSPPTEQDRVEPAAFAPVNAIEDPDTDALMWANGFEADAKSKAEPEQDKRPFWMFTKKELA